MTEGIKNRVPGVSGLFGAVLIPAALSNSIGPYAAVMGAGFIIGVFGHIIHSKLLIITGIVIVGVLSAYIVFGLAKIY
jgi:hypothetical protein